MNSKEDVTNKYEADDPSNTASETQQEKVRMTKSNKWQPHINTMCLYLQQLFTNNTKYRY